MSNVHEIKEITFGADPEVMLINTKTNELVSSIGIIPGVKEEPYDVADGYFLTTDNVLAEYLIPPCKTRESFIESILEGQKRIGLFLPEDVEVLVQASAIYPDKELDSDEARLFGCSSDYNAWTKMVNQKPFAHNINLRSAGGHIHVGYNEPNTDMSEKLVQYMDLFLGVPSVILDRDERRKELYGKAGAFRPKEYGFEYRVLSNFWIKTPELIGWAYDSVREMQEYWNSSGLISFEDAVFIQECINTNNKDLALHLLEKYDIALSFQKA